jgi:phosphoenolpyruvate-protein kinase (PTS system EI component)
MLRLSSLVSFLVVVFLVSCNGDNKEKEIESLKTEVIGIHDEVMPKMDEIMQLKQELQKNIDEQNNDSILSNSSNNAQNVISNLEKADNAMMNWMRNYDPEMEEMTTEEKLEYLQETKKDIQMVKEQMLSAISKSKEFLEQDK